MFLERLEKDLNALPEEMRKTYSELKRSEKYHECLELCEEALKELPDNTAAVVYRGVIFSKLKKYPEAISDFEHVLSIAPEFYHLWCYKGRCELFSDKYEDAIESYKQSIKLYPYISEPWNFVALAYFMSGRDALAMSILDLAIDRVQDKNSILLAKGMLEEHTGDRDAALLSYIQSQLLSSEEDKPVSAEMIYDLFK